MSDEAEFLLELRKIFTEELRDTLENLESAFLDFERNPTDVDILNLIFRLFHNMKGSSKAVGMNALSSYAHIVENVLSRLRNGQLEVNNELIGELLVSTDLITSMIEEINSGSDSLPELDAHGQKIVSLADEISGGGVSEESSDQTAENESTESNDGGFVAFDDAPAENEKAQPAEPEVTNLASEPVVTDASTDSTEQTNLEEGSEPGEKGFKRPYIASIDGLRKSRSKLDASRRAEESIKVPLIKIDTLIDYFGEQMILQSALHHLIMEDDFDLPKIRNTASQLRKITQDLQYTMIRLRMVTMKSLYTRMERVLFDASRMAKKKVNFVKLGAHNELDKNILDSMVDPLTHMVRNAVDHGIEPEEDRIALGKPPQGTVTLSSKRVGGNFEIIIEDDGKGLDPAYLKEKAVRKGILPPGKELTEKEAFNLIFASGFSTKDQASELSGRGVGMDVVREKIESLKGNCHVESELGKGSKFIMRLPLSISMFNGTICHIAGERYVIPNGDYVETIAFNIDQVQSTKQSGSLIQLRDHVVRIIDLGEFYSLGSNDKSSKCLQKDKRMMGIVGEFEGQYFAFLVNEILAQEQIVLKKLGPESRKMIGISGGTILGDGKVALVLDINKIAEHFIVKVYGKKAA